MAAEAAAETVGLRQPLNRSAEVSRKTVTRKEVVVLPASAPGPTPAHRVPSEPSHLSPSGTATPPHKCPEATARHLRKPRPDRWTMSTDGKALSSTTSSVAPMRAQNRVCNSSSRPRRGLRLELARKQWTETLHYGNRRRLFLSRAATGSAQSLHRAPRLSARWMCDLAQPS